MKDELLETKQFLQLEEPVCVLLCDSDFRYNGIDQVIGCDVEGGIPDVDPGSSNVDGLEGDVLLIPAEITDTWPCDSGDFGLCSFLDYDILSFLGTQVDGRSGRSDNELYAMIFGEHGQLVGSDLVGGVSICDDSVCSYHDGSETCSLLSE